MREREREKDSRAEFVSQTQGSVRARTHKNQPGSCISYLKQHLPLLLLYYLVKFLCVHVRSLNYFMTEIYLIYFPLAFSLLSLSTEQDTTAKMVKQTNTQTRRRRRNLQSRVSRGRDSLSFFFLLFERKNWTLSLSLPPPKQRPARSRNIFSHLFKK